MCWLYLTFDYLRIIIIFFCYYYFFFCKNIAFHGSIIYIHFRQMCCCIFSQSICGSQLVKVKNLIVHFFERFSYMNISTYLYLYLHIFSVDYKCKGNEKVERMRKLYNYIASWSLYIDYYNSVDLNRKWLSKGIIFFWHISLQNGVVSTWDE